MVWQCSGRVLRCVGSVEPSTRHPNSAFCGLCWGLKTKTWGFLFSLCELCMLIVSRHCTATHFRSVLQPFSCDTTHPAAASLPPSQLLPGGNRALAVKHWSNWELHYTSKENIYATALKQETQLFYFGWEGVKCSKKILLCLKIKQQEALNNLLQWQIACLT